MGTLGARIGAAALLVAALLVKGSHASLPGCCQVTAGVYDETLTVFDDLAIVCSDCPIDTTSLGLNLTNAVNTHSLTVSCSNCPGVRDFGIFAGSINVATVTCNDCQQLTRVPANVGTYLFGKLEFNCNNCGSLVSPGFAATTGSCVNFFLSLGCTNCGSVIKLWDEPGSDMNLTICELQCTNCPAIQSLVIPSTAWSAYVTCTGCPNLATTVIPYEVTIYSLYLICQGCANAELALFTRLTATALIVACDGCPNLASFLTAELGDPSLVSQLKIQCRDCPRLANFVTMTDPLSRPFFPGVSLQFSCENCRSPTTMTIAPLLASDYVEVDSKYTCINCHGRFQATLPMRYEFVGGHPHVDVYHSGVMLTLTNLAFESSRLHHHGKIGSMALEGVTGLNEYAFWGLQTVESDFGLRNCDLTGLEFMWAINIGGSLRIEDLYNLACLPSRDNFHAKHVSFKVNATICTTDKLPVPSGAAYEIGSTLVTLHYYVDTGQGEKLSLFRVYPTMDLMPLTSWTHQNYTPYSFDITNLDPDTVYGFQVQARLGDANSTSETRYIRTRSKDFDESNSLHCRDDGHYVSSDGKRCVPCPPGSYAAITWASGQNNSLADCRPCPARTFSPLPGQTNCSETCDVCPRGSSALLTFTHVGFLDEIYLKDENVDPLSPSFRQSDLHADGSVPSGVTPVLPTSPLSSIHLILIYGGLFALFAPIVAYFIFRLGIHSKWGSRLSLIVSAPIDYLRIDPERRRVRYIPALIRNAVGACTAVALICGTAFQIHTFFYQQYALRTSLQPDTWFVPFGSDLGGVSSLIGTNFTCSVTLIGSSLDCNANFKVTRSYEIKDTPMEHLKIHHCSAGDFNVTIVYNGTVAQAPRTLLRLEVRGHDGTPAYVPQVSYTIVLERWNVSTLHGTSGVAQATRDSISGIAIAISALSTQYRAFGYFFGFSYESSLSRAVVDNSGDVFTFDVEVTPQPYHLDSVLIENMTPLALLSSLLAVNGGIMTLGAIVLVYASRGLQFWSDRRQRSISMVEPLIPRDADEET